MSANRIDQCFCRLRQSGEKGLIPFITAGDPELRLTMELVLALEEAGADMVELGVPFSDPVADGRVIERASQRALARGTNLNKILQLVSDLRQRTELPLLLMSYYNPVLQYGLERIAREAGAAGVDGLIIPDLPLEESQPLCQELDRFGLYLIPFAAPTTTKSRLFAVSRAARGFIYCVSLTGVTGIRDTLPPQLGEFMGRVRSSCRQPLATGFGISTPQQAAQVAELADAVIVGSALVSLIERYSTQPQLMLERVKRLAADLKGAL